MYTVHAMQRKEEYWGPDGKVPTLSLIIKRLIVSHNSAEEFDPDRFICKS